MAEDRDREQDLLGDSWLTNWEDQCVEEWENESNMEDRIQAENERSAQKLWLSFQNTATSIAQLYKDSLQQGVSLWVPFQNSATSVTIMYKDSLDTMKRSYETGHQCGNHRRTTDILAWAKKRRRHIRREDLIAYLCGKNPPSRHRPSHTHTLNRSASRPTRVSMERSLPRLPAAEPVSPSDEPDLQPFRDALALQGLSGAMSNISVCNSAQGNTACDCSDIDPDFNCFLLDEISRRCEGRKRTASQDVIMESPTRKRSRLL